MKLHVIYAHGIRFGRVAATGLSVAIYGNSQQHGWFPLCDWLKEPKRCWHYSMFDNYLMQLLTMFCRPLSAHIFCTLNPLRLSQQWHTRRKTTASNLRKSLLIMLHTLWTSAVVRPWQRSITPNFRKSFISSYLPSSFFSAGSMPRYAWLLGSVSSPMRKSF